MGYPQQQRDDNPKYIKDWQILLISIYPWKKFVPITTYLIAAISYVHISESQSDRLFLVRTYMVRVA